MPFIPVPDREPDISLDYPDESSSDAKHIDLWVMDIKGVEIFLCYKTDSFSPEDMCSYMKITENKLYYTHNGYDDEFEIDGNEDGVSEYIVNSVRKWADNLDKVLLDE